MTYKKSTTFRQVKRQYCAFSYGFRQPLKPIPLILLGFLWNISIDLKQEN